MMFLKSQPTAEQLQARFPAIFATSEKETLSDKYLYISTYKLVQGLESQGFKIIGAKQAKSRTNSKEHGKHVVYMSHSSLDSLSMKVGQELPMVALTNSHNGLSSFAIDTAFFRLACSNGLLMPTTNLNSARIIHKKGMENDVIEASYSVIKQFPEQIEMIESMKSIQLNGDERYLLAEAATNLSFEQDVIDLNKSLGRDIAPRLLTTRRYEDKSSDLWTTFNVIQENVIKGGVRIVRENEEGRRSLARTRAVNSIDRDSKLNKELMSLAQKFQQLKSGVVA